MTTVTAYLLLCCVVILPLVESAAKEPLPECGTTYMCVVPETCTTDDPSKTTFSARTKVVIAGATTPVTKDCAAIFRYHKYAKHWLHVSIESFIAGTSSIVFNHKNGDNKAVFECKVVNGKVQAKYTAPSVLDQLTPLGDLNGNLKCVFQVLLPEESEVLNAGAGSKAQFTVGPDSSMSTAMNYDMLNCNPLMLKFKRTEDLNPLKKYAEMTYSPGKYECKPESYEKLEWNIEYRLDASNPYKIAKKLECVDSEFQISQEGSQDPIIVPNDDSLYVRCSADAQYFCNYEVKTINTPDAKVTKPVQKMPKIDSSPPEIGEIKCPQTHPIIEVDKKPVIGGEIKCRSQGLITRWKVNDKVLRPNSLEVRCVKDLNCHEIDKIPASSIKKGTLINHIPTCRANGTMKVMPSSQIVKEVYCDTQRGKYMYKTDTQDFDVGKSTFVCEYRTIYDGKKGEEIKSKAFKTGAITTAGIVCGSIILFVIVVVAATVLRKYLAKRRAMKRDQAEWDNHAAEREVEKNAKLLQKRKLGKKKGSQSGSDHNGPNSNPLHLSARMIGSNTASPRGFDTWSNIPGIGWLVPATDVGLATSVRLGEDGKRLTLQKKHEKLAADFECCQLSTKLHLKHKFGGKSKSSTKKHK